MTIEGVWSRLVLKTIRSQSLICLASMRYFKVGIRQLPTFSYIEEHLNQNKNLNKSRDCTVESHGKIKLKNRQMKEMCGGQVA